MSRIYQALVKASEKSQVRSALASGPAPSDHASYARLASFVKAEKKPMCICGCSPRSGVTFIAHNLALALSGLEETVLIDLSQGGDLIRKYGIKSTRGLWDISGGSRKIDAKAEGNLFVMGPGLETPTSSAGHNLEAICEGMGIAQSAGSKHVVVDGGTVDNLSSLALSIGGINMAALVVRLGKTRKNQVTTAIDRLARSGFAFAGIIVNGD